MPDFMQRNFSGGEIGAFATGRTDIEKYAISLAEMTNMVPSVTGAMQNREGLQFIAPASVWDSTVRIEPFIYNNDDVYLLEFTDQCIRVIRDDQFVAESAPQTPTDISSGIVTSVAHGFSVGDFVLWVDAGVRYWLYIDTVPSVDTFTLAEIDGTAFSVADNASPAQTIDRIVTIASPYTASELFDVNITQTANIMTLCHRNHAPRELTRGSDSDWTLSSVNFDPSISAPTNAQALANSFNWSRWFRANDKNYEATVTDITYSTTGTLRFGASYNVGQISVANSTINLLFDGPREVLPDDTYVQFTDKSTTTHNLYTEHVKDVFSSNYATYKLRTTIGGSSYHAFTADDETYYSTLPDVRKIIGVTNNPQVEVAVEDSAGHPTKTSAAKDNLLAAFSDVAGISNFEERNYYLTNKSFTGGTGSQGNGKYTFDLTNLGGSEVNATRWSGTYVSGSARFGPLLLQYAVTAVDAETGEESLPAITNRVAHDDLDNEGPCTITWAAPSGRKVEHYNVYKESNEVFGFIGTANETYFNDRGIEPDFTVQPPTDPIRNPIRTLIDNIETTNPAKTVIHSETHGLKDGDRFYIDDIQTSGYYSDITVDVATTTAPPGSVDPFTDLNGKFYVVVATSGPDTIDEFREVGSASSIAISTNNYTFNGESGYIADWPSISTYYVGRRGFAGQTNKRQDIHWTATGLTSSFDDSAEDAFSVTVNEQSANEIRHIVVSDTVLLFTSGSVVESTSGDAAYDIENVRNIEQTSDPVSMVPPLKARDSILYATEGRSDIYDLSYSFDTDKRGGRRLTVLAPHILEDGNRLVSWSISPAAEPIVWSVWTDGKLRTLTYDRGADVFAWANHETGGLVYDIATMPAYNDWATYVVVEREIDGVTCKYIERVASRDWDKIRDARFLDSCISWDNPISISGITETGGSVKVTTSSAHSVEEDDIVCIEDTLGSTELNDNRYRAALESATELYLVNDAFGSNYSVSEIKHTLGPTDNFYEITHSSGHTVTNDTVVRLTGTGLSELDDTLFVCSPVDADTFKLLNFDGTDFEYGVYSGIDATFSYIGSIAFSTRVTDESVSTYKSGGVLREGITSLGGLNHLEGETVSALVDGDVVTNLTVSSGAVTLPTPGCVIHVGLPYTARARLLPLDNPQGELTASSRSLNKWYGKFYRSRGFEVGVKLDNLVEPEVRSIDTNWDEAAQWWNGDAAGALPGNHEDRGQLYIQTTQPLPLTVQALGYDFEAGF